MKKVALWGAAVLAVSSLIATGAKAQTTIINNNNNININNDNSNGGGDNRRGNRFNDDPGVAVYWRNNPNNMEAWMRMDRSQYRAGTGVRIGLSLTNIGQRYASYMSGDKGEYEIAVYSVRTNRLVWQTNRSQFRRQYTNLDGGATTNWTEYWDQRDSNGNAVPGGAYRVEARVFGLPLSAQVFLTDRNGDRPEPGGPIPPDRNSPGGNLFPGAPRPIGGSASSIVGNLSVDKPSVRRGDSVRIIYTVMNGGRQPVDLVFPSALMFDVTARLSGAAQQRALWRLSDDMAFATMTQRLTLQPGERKVFSCSWVIGNNVGSGQAVDLTATLTPAGQGMVQTAAARTRITVN